MAVTKIKKVKSNLKDALLYIMNDEKTMDGMLVTAYECSPATADREFKTVSRLNKAKSQIDGKSSIMAWHLMQSFSPEDDITPETVHEIGVKYAMEFTQGEHQFIVTTHTDQQHLHNHIIFNATNFKTLKKFNYSQKEMHRREEISDRLCNEYGLSVIKTKSGIRSRKQTEYDAHSKGTSWKDRLRETIDRTILVSDDFDDFITRMEFEEHYEIKFGKYISFRYDDGQESQERFTRSKRLGERYSIAELINRIDNKDKEALLAYDKLSESKTKGKKAQKKNNLIIPIENRLNYLRSQNKLSKNYENKLIVEEINILVSSFNYLQSNNLLYDTDVKGRYDEVEKEVKQFFKKSESIDEKLSPLVTELRYLRNFFNNKDNAKKLKDGVEDADMDELYKSKILYDAAVKYFKTMQINPYKVDEKELQNKINELRADYKEAKTGYEVLKEEKLKLYQVSHNLSKTIGIEPIPSYKSKDKENTKSKSDPKSKTDKEQDQNDPKNEQ